MRCYDCDRPIRKGDDYFRRAVKIAETHSRQNPLQIVPAIHGHYAEVDLCKKCNGRRDKEEASFAKTISFVVLGFLILVAILIALVVLL